jgi:hypothetical protein
MLNSFDWHSVVHGNSDSWAEGVSSNLNDSNFTSFTDELLFKFGVTTLDSENDIDSASPFCLGEFGFIVVTRVINEIPEHSSSLICKINVVVESTILIHVGTVKTCDVHWHYCWSVIICIWRFFMKSPVA